MRRATVPASSESRHPAPPVLNRAAILLRYKEPALRWLNRHALDAGMPTMTLDEVNRERLVYLISCEDGASDDSVSAWVVENYPTLFESELQGWYVEPDLWPRHRDLALFQNWFYVECHNVIFDTVGGEIVDDEL